MFSVLAAVAYQGYVTTVLVRFGSLSRVQVVAQVALVWLVPMLGALVCHWFFRLHGVYEKPRELGYPVGETYDGIEKSDVLNHLP
jgi:hypothetical protein